MLIPGWEGVGDWGDCCREGAQAPLSFLPLAVAPALPRLCSRSLPAPVALALPFLLSLLILVLVLFPLSSPSPRGGGLEGQIDLRSHPELPSNLGCGLPARAFGGPRMRTQQGFADTT